jgi:hypothetical protein
VEIYGGKGIVLMEEAKELLHGKALAQTTAIVLIIPSSEMLALSQSAEGGERAG